MRWPSYEQKQITFERLGYKPFPLQERVHRSAATVVQIVGAEGAGKSFVTSAEVTACVPWADLIYLVGESYENAQAEFNYISRNLQQLGALDPAQISQPKTGRWVMTTKTGCTIVTLSARKGASAVIALGQQPDVIVLCEAGIVESFSVATAAVRRATRARGRVILVGTLKDDYGWYASLVDEFSVTGNAWGGETFSLPTWTNLAIYPGGEQDPEISRPRQILPEEEFARTVAARRMPSQATVFPEFSYAEHVRDCPFDAELPVHIWIDPGYYPSAYVVLPVQFHGPAGVGERSRGAGEQGSRGEEAMPQGGASEVWIIDEIYLNFHTHQEIIEMAKERVWWPNVERGVIDVAGRQHHAEKSAVEVWQAEAGLYLYSGTVGILDGIARHRTFLRPARLFHDPKCKQTLAEYKLYRRKADKDGNATSDLPLDAHNHALKAIAYGLYERFGPVDRRGGMPSALARNEKLREGLEDGGWS